MKIYPTGEGLIRGFMFLGAEGGGVTIKSTYSYFGTTNNVRSYKTNIGYVGGTIGGGISYQPLKILNCTLVSGGAYPNAGRIVYKGGSLPIRIGLSVGVRF
ncbi:MAG: hypothetical protein IPH89_07440 [Bacteroidetes bacterium]|nr:hypothetical protein [Bacteroidota bacterium]